MLIIYEITVVSQKPPRIEKIKFESQTIVAQDVKYEMQTKGYYYLLNGYHIVLNRLSSVVSETLL